MSHIFCARLTDIQFIRRVTNILSSISTPKYIWRIVLSVIICAFGAKPDTAFAVGAGNYDDPWQLGNIAYFNANGTSGTPFYQYGPTYPGGLCSGCLFDTQSVSSVNGERYEQTFTGSRITWWNSLATNRGTKRITIKNAVFPYDTFYTRDVVNYFNTTLRQVARTVKMPGNSANTYIVSIQNTSTDPNRMLMDNDMLTTDIATFGLGSHLHSSTDVRFVGTWNASPGGQGGKSTSPGITNLVRMTGEGEQISVIFNGGPDQGKAYVAIDGGSRFPAAIVDLYSATLTRIGVRFYMSELDGSPLVPSYDRVHNVSVYPEGTKNSSSSGFNITVHSIDAGYLFTAMFSDAS